MDDYDNGYDYATEVYVKRLLKDFPNNKEVILKAVSICGFILTEVNEDFKKDKEIVLAAIKHDVYNICYVDDSLKGDIRILQTAVKLFNQNTVQLINRSK